jgi:hypothetical protein
MGAVFSIFLSVVGNLVDFAEKGCFFDVLIQGFFCGIARNSIFELEWVVIIEWEVLF